MKQHRLLWRIYFWFLTASLVALVLITGHTVISLQAFLDKQTIHNLTLRAKVVAEFVTDKQLTNASSDIKAICSKLGQLTKTRVTIILPDGKVIGDSEKNTLNMDNHANRQEIAKAFKGEIGESSRFSDTLKKKLKYIAIPIKKNGNIAAVVRLSQPVSDIRWTQRIIIHQILMGAASVALLFAVVALYLSRQITRPLEEMRQIADQIANGNLNSHMSTSSTNEIGALAHAINKMAEQLDTRINTIARQQVEQKAMLTCMTEGVLAVDPEGHILYLNNSAAKLLRTSQEQAQGRSIQETVRHYELQTFINDSLIKMDTVKTEIVINDFGEHHIQIHRTPLTDPSGWHMGGLIVMNDITQLKRLETMRTDFVANVSHELKTPITALKGCVETLTAPPHPPPDETARFIGMMECHVTRLEAIVEDLLILSRIEFDLKKSQIELTPSPILKLLEHTVDTFFKRADKKNITTQISCRESLNVPINNDLLEQALGNLIDNAIKYSNEGTEIRINVREKNDYVNIQISDQGPGIAQHHLKRIFERFYRADKARSREFGGTGLGLSIVKHIALAHHGNVTVESTPGKGSTFTIHLPIS